MVLQIHLLGAVEVLVNDRGIELGAAKPRSSGPGSVPSFVVADRRRRFISLPDTGRCAADAEDHRTP
jgi:hypothetical protein